MISSAEIDIFFNLVLAALLGGLIGLEREYARRPAGLRTNMLVCIGAAMFAMIALYSFPSPDAASRVIANIIVGIGFLGAGAVMKDDRSVHGLTTAATIWVVAALGMAVAMKLYFLAIVAEGLILATLVLVHRFERHSAQPPTDSAPRE
jgi:putative Mg2+ transporter-C (MgtC) family protein